MGNKNAQNAEAESIVIWYFDTAPVAYRELSRHGGHETWFFFVPASARQGCLPGGLDAVVNGDECSYLMEWGHEWGHVDKHELDNGDMVIIFAHAKRRDTELCA